MLFFALKNIVTHKKWHKRNLEWIQKSNEKLDQLISRFKTVQKCEYSIAVTSSPSHHCRFPGTPYGRKLKLFTSENVYVRTLTDDTTDYP